MKKVVEIFTFKLAVGNTEEAFKAASEKLNEWIIWPLGIVGWTGKWTLLAWCQLRQDYRSFRFDRCEVLEILGERFAPTAEISMAHFFKSVLGMRDFG